MAANRFNEVLTAAVEDVTERGYDDPNRIAMWMQRLREAAEESFTPVPKMREMLVDALRAIYRRLVEHGGIVQYHPGIERYTLQNVAPSLRAELDRRIAASAELIKLNRQQMVETTLRRFAGWATSIPAGGSDVVARRETKDDIRKALASLPFHERRVVVDQGHKLSASLSEIVAVGAGALAGRWHSHWRQAGYQFREDHKERDERVYMVRDNWAQEKGLAKVGPDGYTDQITAPGEEVYCRCYYTWLYDLGRLPDDMITVKGRQALAPTKVPA